MLKDQIKPAQLTLNFSIPKGKTIDAIVNFLEETLPDFSQDISQVVKAEDDISQECCIYLSRAARSTFFMFHFQHKYLNSKRSSDFSVISAERFSSKEPFFVIEAKRLPTPGKIREREYVQGNLGGIERFKRGKHGQGLLRSAILGYVQDKSYDHWLKEINSWIMDLRKNNIDSTITWEAKDHLKLTSQIKLVNKYSSTHSRRNQLDITLDHYWLYINI